MLRKTLIMFLLVMLSSGSQAALFDRGGGIALGLLDNFNDDTTQGWRHGLPSPSNPNPPTVIPLGGPDGSQYLENLSSGNFGPGGRHIILNTELRWTGDYIAAGVNKIRVNITNFGSAPLNMRVAFRRVDLDCWASTEAHGVPADAVWRNYEFLVDESTMTDVFNSGFGFETAMSDVEEIRILSSAAPSCMGDQVFGISGFDDVQTDADTDLDGINDSIDNCTLVANPTQRDSNGDGFGNACDFDYNNDCVVNFLDLPFFADAFTSGPGDPNWNPDVDWDGNGVINFLDFGAPPNNFAGFFLQPPGPSATACVPVF